MPILADVLSEIAAEMNVISERGNVADYIPELKLVDPSHFAMTVVSNDGTVQSVGSSQTPFSIQSISKVFALTLALGIHGDAIWKRVGREPSGSAFNSIVLLEHELGIPRNPFINAGALVITDILSKRFAQSEKALLQFVRMLADTPDIHFDTEVGTGEIFCSKEHTYSRIDIEEGIVVYTSTGVVGVGGLIIIRCTRTE